MLDYIEHVAYLLLILAGLNGGIDAVAGYDVIGSLLGAGIASTAVYVLVGLSALYVAYAKYIK